MRHDVFETKRLHPLEYHSSPSLRDGNPKVLVASGHGVRLLQNPIRRQKDV